MGKFQDFMSYFERPETQRWLWPTFTAVGLAPIVGNALEKAHKQNQYNKWEATQNAYLNNKSGILSPYAARSAVGAGDSGYQSAMRYLQSASKMASVIQYQDETGDNIEDIHNFLRQAKEHVRRRRLEVGAEETAGIDDGGGPILRAETAGTVGGGPSAMGGY